MSTKPYPIARIVIPPIIKFWIREVNGLENVPKKGPFIMAANHASYMDHLIIICTLMPYLNRKIHFLSKKEHFNNPLKAAWHSWAGAIPLDREGGGKEVLEWAIRALKNRKIIAIHPEGTRTLTGSLQRGKTGVVRLALAARVPIVPVGIKGTFEILPKGAWIPKFNKKAIMNIGKPIYLSKYYGEKMTKKMLRGIVDRIIMKELVRLCGQDGSY